MALLFSERFRADIGGHRFLALEVTADGTTTDLTAASIGLTSIETAMIASKADIETVGDQTASIAAGAGLTLSMAVGSVELGDFMLMAASVDLEDMIATANPDAEGKVEIRVQNETAASIDLTAKSFNVLVLKRMGLSTLSGTKISFWPPLENGNKFTVWIIGR